LGVGVKTGAVIGLIMLIAFLVGHEWVDVGLLVIGCAVFATGAYAYRVYIDPQMRIAEDHRQDARLLDEADERLRDASTRMANSLRDLNAAANRIDETSANARRRMDAAAESFKRQYG